MNFSLKKEDKMVSIFLKSIGPWKNHIIIGGGFAPIIYKLYLANVNNVLILTHFF